MCYWVCRVPIRCWVVWSIFWVRWFNLLSFRVVRKFAGSITIRWVCKFRVLSSKLLVEFTRFCRVFAVCCWFASCNQVCFPRFDLAMCSSIVVCSLSFSFIFGFWVLWFRRFLCCLREFVVWAVGHRVGCYIRCGFEFVYLENYVLCSLGLALFKFGLRCLRP